MILLMLMILIDTRYSILDVSCCRGGAFKTLSSREIAAARGLVLVIKAGSQERGARWWIGRSAGRC